jgi:hypothetical protein
MNPLVAIIGALSCYVCGWCRLKRAIRTGLRPFGQRLPAMADNGVSDFRASSREFSEFVGIG